MAKRPHSSRRPGGLARILGLTNKPRPSSKRLAPLSHNALRRASPAENVKLGFSPKARRYVKADVKKITKATASVSARHAETKRTQAVHGVSLSEATKLRREGQLSYSSQDQAKRVAKAEDRRLMRYAHESVGKHLWSIKPNGHRYKIRITNETVEFYERVREQKLNGGWIDDNGDFARMMEIGAALKDNRLPQLRQSPNTRRGAIGL
jgi:hypothetical protein